MSLDQLKRNLTTFAYWPHKNAGIGEIKFKELDPTRKGDSLCYISPTAKIDLTGNLFLGKWVMIGHGTHIITHNHNLSGKIPRLLQAEQNQTVSPHDKTIEDNVWIFNAIILPQCSSIAQGVVIGAGAVVAQPIKQEYSIWAGNPARLIKYIE